MLRFIGFVNEFMDEGDARRDSVSCFRGIADTQVLSTLLASSLRIAAVTTVILVLPQARKRSANSRIGGLCRIGVIAGK
jgi:hypothetical protein